MDKYCIIGRKNEDIVDILLNNYTQYSINCDYDKAMSDWKASYRNSTKQILKQFEIDFYRSSVILNHNIMNDFLRCKNGIKQISPNLCNDIYIMCSQTVMSKALELFYTKHYDDIYLMEIEPSNNSIKRQLEIHINNIKNNISIVVKKNLKIANINDCYTQTLRYLSIDVIFNLDDKKIEENTIEILFTPFFEYNNFILV